ncbi:hypothetical protein A15K_02465 [Escherichia coli KTE205]|nr:hypothetical protein A15K_02465 [Escherichia coli KTE205]
MPFLEEILVLALLLTGRGIQPLPEIPLRGMFKLMLRHNVILVILCIYACVESALLYH